VPEERGLAAPDRPQPRAVIIDWGGVMTSPITDTINAWIHSEGIDKARYAELMRGWVRQAYDDDGPANPIHALERGEVTDAEFEALLAAQITLADGSPLAADGLLARMFAAMKRDEGMFGVIRAVRRSGFRTALLSNSWGSFGYPRDQFSELFDVVVISGETGMRKPEERIFRHATSLLGLAPDQCVFIDDIDRNISAAEAIGMTGILHRDLAATTTRLAELLSLPAAALTG
jgi:putative hydrolase of the HAD superfamily